MRTNEPYELKVSPKTAQLALKAIRKFCLDLGRVPEPQPRLKCWALDFSKSNIVWGNPSEIDMGGQFGIVFDFSDRKEGVSAKQLQIMLFNVFVSERMTKTLMWAMMYAADIEANGSNDINAGLLDREIAKAYAIGRESMALGWF